MPSATYPSALALPSKAAAPTKPPEPLSAPHLLLPGSAGHLPLHLGRRLLSPFPLLLPLPLLPHGARPRGEHRARLAALAALGAPRGGQRRRPRPAASRPRPASCPSRGGPLQARLAELGSPRLLVAPLLFLKQLRVGAEGGRRACGALSRFCEPRCAGQRF